MSGHAIITGTMDKSKKLTGLFSLTLLNVCQTPLIVFGALQ